MIFFSLIKRSTCNDKISTRLTNKYVLFRTISIEFTWDRFTYPIGFCIANFRRLFKYCYGPSSKHNKTRGIISLYKRSKNAGVYRSWFLNHWKYLLIILDYNGIIEIPNVRQTHFNTKYITLLDLNSITWTSVRISVKYDRQLKFGFFTVFHINTRGNFCRINQYLAMRAHVSGF